MKPKPDKYNVAVKPFFILAPMYDVTDTVFRQVIADIAPPSLYFTEFVNVDGLQSAGRDKIIHRLRYTAKEKPIVAQVWGKDPKNYLQTARELASMGFDGIDINMGCPDKAVLKNGCCAALINDPELAGKIILATKKGSSGKIPVSVKTRIGYREFDEPWLRFLLSQKLDMLTVHLRTVKEMSKVPAHWEMMSRIRQLKDELAPGTLLVGNGDVHSLAQARELARENGIDGVMIGRGVFENPYLFSEKANWHSTQPKQKIALFKKHVQLFQSTWQKGEYPIVALNKFCKIYINGFDGAKEVRSELMAAKSAKDLLDKLSLVENNISDKV